MKLDLKRLILVFVFLIIILNIKNPLLAIECSTKVSLTTQEQINEFEEKCIKPLRNQINTLSEQIQYMDNQIYLTSVKINQTEQKIIETQKEIEVLGSRIEGLDESLNHISKLMLQKIVKDYKQKQITFFSLFFESENFSDLLSKIKYIKTVRDNNQKLLVQLQQAKINFEEQKNLREEKKKELDVLTQTLNDQKNFLTNQKIQKQRLLEETNNNEAVFQNLVSRAKAQLAAFGRFTQIQGGASILNNQTVCDSWGCYYNQRDSQWGNVPLNGTSYTLASDGCLVTSMAMIYTHYGYRNVTPLEVNSNPNNFASYYPAWLYFNISVNGVSSSRELIDKQRMDEELNNGRPVVVGIAYNSCRHSDGRYYADHFVVLTKKNGNDYLMHDPFTPNGNNISFYSKYSNICEIYKVKF